MLGKIVRDLITCPLSGRVMADPVCASDGFVYERAALEKRLVSDPKSPVTQEPLSDVIFPASLMAIFIRMLGASFQLHQESRELSVPKRSLGYLIGKKGRTIQKIQYITGTRITVDQTQDPCMLTFTGGDVTRAVVYAECVLKNFDDKRQN
jgi:hypothetical protein